MMASEVIERRVFRALLLSPEDEVLLIRTVEPESGRALWLTPGGGVEGQETPEDCLRRELYEETGLTDFRVGPEIWFRRHACIWAGKPYACFERFFMVRAPLFEPRAAGHPESGTAFRWWSRRQIESSDETFVPRNLAHWLGTLLREGTPSMPVDVGE